MPSQSSHTGGADSPQRAPFTLSAEGVKDALDMGVDPKELFFILSVALDKTDENAYARDMAQLVQLVKQHQQTARQQQATGMQVGTNYGTIMGQTTQATISGISSSLPPAS